MAATAADASWKNPRILKTALTGWAARDDTREDPAAVAAGDDALAAIDVMIAELTALRARVADERAAYLFRGVPDAEVMPAAAPAGIPPLAPPEPGDAETRLLRAACGLCPDGERTDEDSRQCRDCGQTAGDRPARIAAAAAADGGTAAQPLYAVPDSYSVPAARDCRHQARELLNVLAGEIASRETGLYGDIATWDERCMYQMTPAGGT